MQLARFYLVTTLLAALLGIDRALRRGSLRMLVGPAQFNGGGDRSIGLQSRITLGTKAFSHIAFGFTAHATLLPNHDDATLVMFGGGFGFTFR